MSKLPSCSECARLRGEFAELEERQHEQQHANLHREIKLEEELDMFRTVARRADSKLAMALAWDISVEAQRYVQEARGVLAALLEGTQ